MKLKLAITFPTLTRPVKRARFGRCTSLFPGSNCHLFRLVNGLYDTPYTLSRSTWQITFKKNGDEIAPKNVEELNV